MAERKGPTIERGVTRVPADGSGQSALDRIAVEEPLEIRIAGDPIAVTMRTPGHDRELALGFLFAEGIIRSAADVSSLAHCGRPGEEAFENTLDVRAAPGVVLSEPGELQRRGTLTTSACGVCGRRSIDDLLARCTPPVGTRPSPTLALLRGSVERLRAHQPSFERTGALHAAAILDQTGNVLAAAEDVGRHNAVDKAIGTLLLRDARSGAEPALRGGSTSDIGTGPGLAAACALAVSGRISFEIIQKACVAGIPAVCGISAPTSLAIELAERCQIALAGFVRDGALNLYSDRARDLVHSAVVL